MKTRGQLVKEWREARGMTTRALAKAIGTSRQNIENLEADTVDQPRYLPALARYMGYGSTDELLALKEPPSSSALEVQEPPADYEEGDFVPTSEREWRLFQAFKQLPPELQERHLQNVEDAAMKEMGRKLFAETLRSKGFALDKRVAAAYGAPPDPPEPPDPAPPDYPQMASPLSGAKGRKNTGKTGTKP